jgi:hypothetical protein
MNTVETLIYTSGGVHVMWEHVNDGEFLVSEPFYQPGYSHLPRGALVVELANLLVCQRARSQEHLEAAKRGTYQMRYFRPSVPDRMSHSIFSATGRYPLMLAFLSQSSKPIAHSCLYTAYRTLLVLA